MNVGPDGLGSVATVPLLGGDAKLLNVAADAGYGFTEGVLDQGDRHHRVNLGVAAGVSPLPGWSGSLQLAGRYDGHRLGDGTHDSGLVVRPRLAGRGVVEVGDDLFLGGQLALQPGPTFSPGKALSGFAAELDGLVGTVQGPLQLSGRLGLRFDRGRHAVDNANTLSESDRLALGVSDAPEVRFGVGGLYALIPMLSLLSEITWDVPVGAKAVAAFDGPLWLRVGARTPLGDRFQLGLLASISPSGRPDPQPTGDLARVEPRFYLGVTLAATALEGTQSVKPPPTIETPPARVIITVSAHDGALLAGATVQTGGASCTTADDGTCSLLAATNEPRLVHVEALGYAPTDQSYAQSDTDQNLTVALSPLPVTVQGQLLSDKGQPVVGAHISVLRGDRQFDSTTDAQGNFAIADLELGEAVLRIEAESLPASEQALVIAPGLPPLALTAGDNLNAGETTGQIRGTVRTFDGAPVAAIVTMTPKKRDIQCDAKGEFSVDVPPGKYRISVKAPGYRPQRRTAVVEAHSVTVLVVELTANQ